MRVLAVDYGRVRIGLAVAGELAVATPLSAVPGGPGAARRVSEIARKEGAARIVLGDPRSLSGARGPMSAEVDLFRAELEAESGLPVELLDERCTSRAAEASLRGAKGAAKRRKDGSLDCAAATLLLASWLERAR